MPNSSLSVGAYGDSVTRLHDLLRKHGYQLPVSEVGRNFFGPATRAAVQQFQRQNGLTVSGVVNEQTAKALNATIAAFNAQNPQPTLPKTDVSAGLQATEARTEDTRPQGTLPFRSLGTIGSPVSTLADRLHALLQGSSEAAASSGPGRPFSPTESDQLYVVHGQVTSRGLPVSGVTVFAVDMDLRGFNPLGLGDNSSTNITDKTGQYSITYSASQFARAEKDSADLIFFLNYAENFIVGFSAFDKSGQPLQKLELLIPGPEPVFIVQIKPNAEVDETVNFDLAPGAANVPSEYERLLDELDPLLSNVQPPNIHTLTIFDRLAELNKQDLDFLTLETGIERNKLEALVTAVKLSRDPFGNQFDPALFYGLAGEGLPLDLPLLARKSQQQRQEALDKAFDENIIPGNLRNSAAGFLQQLESDLAGHALNAPLGEGRAPLGDLLSMAKLPPDLQATFFTAYTNHDGPIEDFWKALREQPSFQQPGVVNTLQLTLQLGLVTQNHLPLMQALQQRFPVAAAQDLVKIDKAAWTNLVNQDGVGIPPGVAGTTPDEQTKNYIDSIVGAVQVAFPTATMAQIVATAPGINIDDTTKSNVTRFFANAPDFDLRTSTVDAYIANQGATAFNGIAESDHPQVISEVKRLQRVFQVSTSAETATALLGTDLNSARAIATIPRSSFIASYAAKLGGKAQATAVHDRATYIHGRATYIYTHLRQSAFDALPRAIGATDTVQASLKQLPNYTELFGPINFCDCKDCRSVLSPAAYFVDLLEFLRKSSPNKSNITVPDRSQSGLTPLDILLGVRFGEINIVGRRPDLAYIKLSCENTNTLIPYVDLVNEILETFIASNPPNTTLGNPPNDSTDGVTADELAANPENTNQDAYKKLSADEAVYPFTLPFNLPLETARVYLEFLGSSLYEVMRIFRKEDTDAALRALDAEFLKITPEEYKILTGKNFDGTDVTPAKQVRKFYGYDAAVVSADVVWVEDSLPSGANPFSDADSWNWITANPAPASGAKAHQSMTVPGFHQHYFQDATETLLLSPGDRLFTQIFLDPGNLPEEVMLQWNDGTWEHRAYWGANRMDWGVDGTASRQYMGPLPSAGKWVRLEVPARLVGLEGKQLNGMAFTLYGGGATWDYSGNRSASWQELIAYVPEFLQRTGISYLELVELLKTAFINPQPQAPEAITLFSPTSTCDLSITYLQHLDGTPLNDPELSRMHRLIRLWRKLGWAMVDVDRMLMAFKANDTTPDVVQGFAIAAQLQADLTLPIQVLASLWADIDRQGDDALYSKLFLNKAVRKIDSAFEPKNDGSVLSDQGLFINHHVPALLAALRLSEADFALIRLDLKLDSDNAPLTLATVSSLYRYVVLAKALTLRITELLSLKMLSGINPFAGPDLTQQFVALVRKVRDSGLRIAQLDYLYRHISQPPTGLAPQSSAILQLVKTLRDGLAKIQTDNVMVEDPRGEVTRSKLALIFESNIVDQSVRMVDGTTVYTTPLAALPSSISFPDLVKSKIAYDKSAKSLHYTGAMTSTELNLLLGLPQVDDPFKQAVQALYDQPGAFIENSLTGFLVDPAESEKTLLRNFPSLDQNGQPVLLDASDTPVTDPTKAVRTAIAKKFDYFLGKLLPYLRDKLSHSLAKQTLGDALKLDSATTAALLENILKSQKDAQQPAVNDILDLATSGLSASYYPNPSLSGSPAQTGVDKTIDFDGKRATLPLGTNSVRWAGKLIAPGKDPVTFFVRASGATRLWLGDNVEPLIEGQSPNELASQPTTLKAGQLYGLRLEVTQLSAQAVVEFRWQSATMPKDIVPESALCPETVLATFTTTFTRLQKASMLINGFALTADEVSYLFDAGHAKDFDDIDLQSLPLDRVAPNTVDQQAPGLFKSWQRLADYASLRNNLPQGQIRLIDVFSAASVADKLLTSLPTNLENDTRKQTALDIAKANLLGATGWDEVLVDALVGSETFKVAPAPPPPPVAGFKDERWLLRLRNCAAMIRRLGVSAPKLFSWGSPASGFDSLQSMTQDIKRTVKAKYDDETWLTVAKPLSDKLREAQKNALIAYIVTLPSLQQAGILDADQLYEYFLIDVQMDACMQTSRIKQAISSVQLFVQRCLLNLEDQGDASLLTVKPSQIDADQWQWRKHYRVWEANRKVFLYPENWLEPELRDDKSEFFKELESELLQSDLNMDAAETAFMNYLEKLDKIARLTIWGMYWQDKDPDTGKDVNILHVFGRTGPGKPHTYYYRQLVDGNRWTAWEKVQADIQGIEADTDTPISGVHLLPVIWNRRLYLFWPEFMKVPDQSNTSINPNGTLSATASPQHLELRLAWTEYKQGKWSPKQISVPIQTDAPPIQSSHFIFRSFIDQANVLRIRSIAIWFADSDRASNELQQSVNIARQISQFAFPGCGTVVKAEAEPKSVIDTASWTDTLVIAPGNTLHTFTVFYFYSGPPIFYFGDFDHDSVNTFNYLKTRSEVKPLNQTPSDYSIAYPQQFHQYLLQTPFFYQDDLRTYFVTPSLAFDFISQLSKRDKINFQFSPALVKVAIKVEQMAPAISNTRRFNAEQTESAVPATAISNSSTSLAQSTSNWAVQSLSKVYNWKYSSDLGAAPNIKSTYHFTFLKHFHPYVCEFMKRLAHGGITELLSSDTQTLRETTSTNDQDYLFNANYAPDKLDVEHPYPVEDVEFDYGSAYSLYNWEIFFHAPLLIATRLSKNQRFESAMKWFHYIFNPTTDSQESAPARYWNVVPFKTTQQQNIVDFLNALDAAKDDPQSPLNKQVEDWASHPFDPHLIARLRVIAYQKNVFMKYLDNLIAWGDQLFSQDTIESINEATQLYVLAADLLGPRPQRIPQRGKVADETYADLTASGTLDEFSNKLVTLENQFPFSSDVTVPESGGQSGGLLGLGTTLYFCVPQNDKLLGYWDTVADRLFKIRHCMNIAGVVRQLPLFEPPIDPALLVQAAAAGLDIGSVLSDINSPLPCYRLTYTLQKALELCAELKSLGSALLSALEKKDAEDLAAKRAHHETQLLGLIKAVKEQQRDEALASAEALAKSRDMAVGRYNYYQTLLGEQPTTPAFGEDVPVKPINLDLVQDENTGGMKLLAQERDDLSNSRIADAMQQSAASEEYLANELHQIPEITENMEPFGLGVSIGFGGGQFGAGASALAAQDRAISASYSFMASVSSKLANFARRDIESLNQKNNAAREIMQIDKQIAAAKIRVDIALKEIDNQQTQIDNAQQIEDFLRTKYTNQDLYGWMEGTISTIYFQAYQLVYDLAKKAEKAFRFERGLIESNFIKFGYWDSLHKGLLAGEQLYFSLKQMESAYHEQNKREYEITKHVSLLLNDPMALIKLKETGQCEIFLPETLFDTDYPGHYMRRLKSISLTIPCVVGPYTSINCTLTLLNNKTRIKSVVGPSYSESEDGEDERFVTNFAAMQSIATSHAQNDSGMFDLNFRDERYLPFEGAGAISRWRIELPRENNAFDFNTISDVILHLKYTAREGGDILKNAARAAMQKAIADEEQNLLARFFSIKHEFPTEWYRLLTAPNDTGDHIQSVKIPQNRFPFLFQGRTITINRIDLFGIPQMGKQVAELPELTLPDQQPAQLRDDATIGQPGQLLHKLADPLSLNVDWDESKAAWTFKVSKDKVKTLEPLDDILLVCHYTIKSIR